MPEDDSEISVADFTYCGPGERTYPETRDAEGRNLGVARPGDIRPFTAAPDQFWRQTADGDRAALEARDAPAAGGGDHEPAAPPAGVADETGEAPEDDGDRGDGAAQDGPEDSGDAVSGAAPPDPGTEPEPPAGEPQDM